MKTIQKNGKKLKITSKVKNEEKKRKRKEAKTKQNKQRIFCWYEYLISAANREFAQNNRAIRETGATGSCFAGASGVIYKSI